MEGSPVRVDSTATTPTDGSACKAVLNCAAGMAVGYRTKKGKGMGGIKGRFSKIKWAINKGIIASNIMK